MTDDPDEPEEAPTDEPADPRADAGERMERSRPSSDPRSDGGTAGADDMVLDPWGSATIEDYGELFDQFGIEAFDEVLSEVPNPHYLMRRGIIFGHRDYRAMVDAMRNDEPVAALSGFMPTGEPHVGHKMVFDELVWHQQQGADTYGLIADLEAHSARGLSWDEIDAHARDYLLSLLALGFDPHEGELYRQSGNRVVQDLAFELGIEANFSEMQAIYGFDRETDVSHLQSVITQAADILYPQLNEPKPTIIPVGPDQDPHLRLTRDLAQRMRDFKVTEAYLSQELDEEERIIADWLNEEVRSIFLSTVESQEPVDIAGGTFGFINCAQAAKLLRSLNDYLNQRSDQFPQFRISELAKLSEDYSEDDWEEVLGELDLSQERIPSDAASQGLDSLIKKLDNAGKEPFRERIRIFNRTENKKSFSSLIDATDNYNRRVYEGHIDIFNIEIADAEELAREVEVDHGGYGFYLPSSLYHRFMTGLTGGKMSSSVPASHISLLDDPEVGYEKVTDATTGGRETAELQRELGGEADECPVYELYAYLLAGDDDEYATRVYEECYGGERLCGDCKEEAAELMREFLEEHQEKREEMEPVLESLDVELDSPRKR